MKISKYYWFPLILSFLLSACGGTTSAGLAWTLGRADTQVTRDEVLEHLRPQLARDASHLVQRSADRRESEVDPPLRQAEQRHPRLGISSGGVSDEFSIVPEYVAAAPPNSARKSRGTTSAAWPSE